MAIQASELIAYGCASRPLDDASTTGGAINKKSRPSFTQLTTNAVIAIQSSSSSDTMVATVVGRDSAGGTQTETITLTGTTEKVGTKTFERITSVTLASDAVGTVTVKQGPGGSTVGTIPAGENEFYAMFINSASDSTSQVFYEKFFWYNKSAEGKTLNAAKIRLSLDPSNKIQIGVATAKNGSSTIANRLSVPSGITFVDDNVDQNVPGTTLEANSGIEVWSQLTLAPNDPPIKSSYTTQITGKST